MTLQELMDMQRELHAKNRDRWDPLTPEYARNSLLWMMEEVGEVVAIVKKKGEQTIADDPAVRAAFVTEMGDALMYYVDVLLRMGITAQEFEDAYRAKHEKNMGRDYQKEYQGFLH